MVAQVVDAALVRAWFRAAARSIADQREALTDLDAAIGDGDHGVNMERGFSVMLTALDDAPADDPPGSLLILAGKTLVSSIGGTTGPVRGQALRGCGADPR